MITIRVQLRLSIQFPCFSEEKLEVEHGYYVLGWKRWSRVLETLSWLRQGSWEGLGGLGMYLGGGDSIRHSGGKCFSILIIMMTILELTC